MTSHEHARLAVETGGGTVTIAKWDRGEPVGPFTHYALRRACERTGIPLPPWCGGDGGANAEAGAAVPGGAA